MTDLKTVRAFSEIARLERELELVQRRYEFLSNLTPRAFEELKRASETGTISLDQLVDSWVAQI